MAPTTYIEPIEAPVKGIKVFRYDFQRGLLSSPVMSTYWLPNDTGLYTGEHGLFFWAVPEKLIAIAEPPTLIGLAVVEVVPSSCAPIANLVPSPLHAISPNPFSNFDDSDCDCFVARNFVAVARVLRLLELRVLSVCTKADIRRLEKAYRIPVTIVQDLRMIACFGSQEFHILDNTGQYKIPRSLVTSRYKSFYYRQSPHQEYCREYKWDFADSRQVFDNVVAELFSSREAQTN